MTLLTLMVIICIDGAQLCDANANCSIEGDGEQIGRRKYCLEIELAFLYLGELVLKENSGAVTCEFYCILFVVLVFLVIIYSYVVMYMVIVCSYNGCYMRYICLLACMFEGAIVYLTLCASEDDQGIQRDNDQTKLLTG